MLIKNLRVIFLCLPICLHFSLATSEEYLKDVSLNEHPTTNEVKAVSGNSKKETGGDIKPDIGLKPVLKELENLKKEIQSLRDELEVRKKLQITEDEKAREEEEVLSATGREYTLLKSGTVGMEYSLSYSYYSYASLLTTDSNNLSDNLTDSNKGTYYDLIDYYKYFGNHVMDHTLFIEYAYLDNLTFNINVPFTLRYENEETDNSKSVNDLGDISIGFQFQPIKVGGQKPAVTFSSNLSCPTGRSPYEIDRETDISTGNGHYAISTGISLSKSIDPLIAFGSFNYTCNFSEDGLNQTVYANQVLIKTAPGDILGFSMGFATALSYNVSLNMSYQYSYKMESTFYFEENQSTKSRSTVSSIFSVGTGWRYSPKRTINVRISIGLTENDPNVTVSFILPIEFALE